MYSGWVLVLAAVKAPGKKQKLLLFFFKCRVIKTAIRVMVIEVAVIWSSSKCSPSIKIEIFLTSLYKALTQVPYKSAIST